jgi:hypothetical protein
MNASEPTAFYLRSFARVRVQRSSIGTGPAPQERLQNIRASLFPLWGDARNFVKEKSIFGIVKGT